MSASRIAARYAKAFVAVLEEKKAMDEVAVFLEFCDLVAGNAQLVALFANVTVSSDDKTGVVKALSQRLSLPGNVDRFLTTLAEGGRLALLPHVKEAVSREVDARSNIRTVQLTTATAPGDDQIEAIAAALGRRLDSQIRVEAEVNPKILGGAIARVGSLVYDGSVYGQLQRLRRDLVKES